MGVHTSQANDKLTTAQTKMVSNIPGIITKGRFRERPASRWMYEVDEYWKRQAQDRQMWTQQAQVLEETGAGQADVDSACSGVGRDWSRTGRCGLGMLRCWKRLEQDRQMWTRHAQVLEETGAGQADVDSACSGVRPPTGHHGYTMVTMEIMIRVKSDRQIDILHGQCVKRRSALL